MICSCVWNRSKVYPCVEMECREQHLNSALKL
jgi:hypothetical protein